MIPNYSDVEECWMAGVVQQRGAPPGVLPSHSLVVYCKKENLLISREIV